MRFYTQQFLRHKNPYTDTHTLTRILGYLGEPT